MISKEMYEFLKEIPRRPQSILFGELEKLCKNDVSQIVYEANDESQGYILQMSVGNTIQNCSFSLTDSGQAEIEEYERSMRNQEIVEKNLKISRAAMWAAVASAAVAVVSLVASLIKLFV